MSRVLGVLVSLELSFLTLAANSLLHFLCDLFALLETLR